MTDLASRQDHLLFADTLIEIERRINVNEITLDGVHLWPMIRLELGRPLKRPDPEEGPPVRRSAGAASKEAAVPGQGFFSTLMGRLGGRVGLGRAEPPKGAKFPATAEARKVGRQAYRARLREELENGPALLEAQRERWRAAGPLDFAVLSKVEKYYATRDGKRYAPITDPVYEDLCRRGRTVALAQEPLGFECVHEPLRFDVELHMLLNKRTRTEFPGRVEQQIGEINRLLKEIAPQIKLDTRHFVNRYERNLRKRAFFHDMFSVLRPKVVFESSYTGWTPAIWACRELGIQVVDIQHGGQGPTHYPTTHWTDVPPEGYAFLPDFFWVWGEPIRRFIDPWLPGGSIRHVPVVGGNRNLAKWKRDRAEGHLGTKDLAFLERLAGQGRFIVLVTLSYAVEDILPDSIVEAIGATPDWLWLIRLHPIHRGTDVQKEIRERLRRHIDSSNYEIDEPTDVSLHTALAACDSHVTPFSTACREALAIGVPTTICHPLGGNFFAEEIESGLYSYAVCADELAKTIDASSRSAEAEKTEVQIETRDEAVDAVLKQVLAAWERDNPDTSVAPAR